MLDTSAKTNANNQNNERHDKSLQAFEAVFRTDPYLYHTFENMIIFRPGNLQSLCSPGNQDYQKIDF